MPDTSSGTPLHKVIERIRKALALADQGRSNTTEAEAATAAALAARLMEEYQIEQATILSAGIGEDEPIEDIPLDSKEGRGYYFQWRGVIIAALAKTNNCRAYRHRERGGAIHILGRQSDVQAIQFLQSFICSQIELVTDSEWNRRGVLSGEHGRKWKTSFKVGCSSRVAQRIEDEHWRRQQALRNDPAMAGALMVINKRMAKVDRLAKIIGLSGGRRATATSEDAYEAGRSAGDRIKISEAKALPEPRSQLQS